MLNIFYVLLTLLILIDIAIKLIYRSLTNRMKNSDPNIYEKYLEEKVPFNKIKSLYKFIVNNNNSQLPSDIQKRANIFCLFYKIRLASLYSVVFLLFLASILLLLKGAEII